MSKRFPVNKFKWVEDLSELNKDFIKRYSEKVIIFFEADIQYPKNLHEHHNDLPFLLKVKKVNKVKKFQLTCKIKKHIL